MTEEQKESLKTPETPDPYANLASKSQAAAEILQQTSTEIFVEWKEIEEILTKNFPNQEIPPLYKAIGLSASSFYDGRKTNKVKKTTKYALLGLAKEKTDQASHQFSHQELILIFGGLLELRTKDLETRNQITNLQKILAKLIAQQS